MDEIEMKRAYNECVNLINNVPYQDSEANRAMQRALNLMLQMIWQVYEDIQEMQVEDDDE